MNNPSQNDSSIPDESAHSRVDSSEGCRGSDFDTPSEESDVPESPNAGFLFVAGIDPGFDGGIAILRKSVHIPETDPFPVAVIPMPYIGEGKNKTVDTVQVIRFLAKWMPHRVFIEKVGARPGQGVSSMFTFGYNAGKLEGAILGMGFSLSFTRPQEWQTILRGYNKEGKPSTAFCAHRWPNTNWRANERCRTSHDGMTDAACIAYWGILQQNH